MSIKDYRLKTSLINVHYSDLPKPLLFFAHYFPVLVLPYKRKKSYF